MTYAISSGWIPPKSIGRQCWLSSSLIAASAATIRSSALLYVSIIRGLSFITFWIAVSFCADRNWTACTIGLLDKSSVLNNSEGSRVVLVLSNKKDSYYVVTPTKCSCPAATYHPGQPCKHQRQFFPQEQVATVAESGIIRPEGKWPGGLNGPVDECKGMA